MEAVQNLLTVENLTKTYFLGGGLSRRRLTAVNLASFILPPNRSEVFTLAGESGSGKTTIAKMILGMVEPTSGRLLYKGKDIANSRKRAERMRLMREIQPVFQNPFETFNPLKKVKSYLFETALNFRKATSRAEAERVINLSLACVGLSLNEVQGKYPCEFSGGQLQRVSIARSLITEPSLLVTDEPVSMVDASLRMSIVNLFKNLKEQQGVSVLYITHDLATAYYVSDRIAIMLRGNIVELGGVEAVLDNPRHPYTKILKESIPESNPELKWTVDIALTDMEVSEYSQEGCKFCGRCPHVMDVCRKIDPAFIEVAGRLVKCHLYR